LFVEEKVWKSGNPLDTSVLIPMQFETVSLSIVERIGSRELNVRNFASKGTRVPRPVSFHAKAPARPAKRYEGPFRADVKIDRGDMREVVKIEGYFLEVALKRGFTASR
jgi:hypothetical protein